MRWRSTFAPPAEAYATREAGLAFLHSAKGPSDPPAKALGDSRVSTHRVRGRDVHVVRGPGHTASAAGAVVYLHGGAYTNEVVDQQWAFVAALAARTGVRVHVPIYGLAPHHTASEAVDLVAEVVHGLVAQGRSVVLLGDSAGGGRPGRRPSRRRPPCASGWPACC